MASPHTSRSPQTSLCAQLKVSPFESVVTGVTDLVSHQELSGTLVLIAPARVIAPAALSEPAPWLSVSAPKISLAVNCRMALTVLGVGVRPLFAARLA